MRSRHVSVLRSIASVLAVLFVALAVWVDLGDSLPGDRRTLVELNEAVGTSLDDAMVTIGVATDSVVIGAVAIVVVAVLAYVGRRTDALAFASIVGAVLVLNPIMKYVIGRARPDVRFSPEVVSSHAFPSGHAAGTAALVGALVLVAPTPRSRLVNAVVGGVVLVVVAFSRLAIGVHYPSDIVGGWLWVASLVLAVWSVRAVAGSTGAGRSGGRPQVRRQPVPGGPDPPIDSRD